jgi:hypothetical protein
MIEVLVVVVMIAVLAVLTVSGTRSMLMSSKQAASAGNLRSLGVAMHIYAQDHSGSFPETTHTEELEGAWVYRLREYLGEFDEARICPADPNRVQRLKSKGTSYILNSYIFVPQLGPFGDPIGPQLNRLTAIPEPSRTLMAVICSDRTGTGPGNDHTHSTEWSSWQGVCRDVAVDRFGTVSPDRTQGRSSYLFVDGRVESISAGELKRKTQAGVNFAKPPGVKGLP